MTETEAQQKIKSVKRRAFSGVFLTASIGLVIFFIVKGCSDNISPDVANLVLKTGDKAYVYSPMGTSIVQASIADHNSPSAMATIRVFKDDEKYFVEPGNMQPIVDVMAGNIVYFDYKEKSSDGYVTSDDKDAYSIATTNESTETIGEQLAVSHVVLKRTKSDWMDVKWSFNSKTGEYAAIEKCAVRSFWIQTNPSPGETVISSKDFLVVSLDGLARYFNCKVDYDPETRVLYVIKN